MRLSGPLDRSGSEREGHAEEVGRAAGRTEALARWCGGHLASRRSYGVSDTLSNVAVASALLS